MKPIGVKRSLLLQRLSFGHLCLFFCCAVVVVWNVVLTSGDHQMQYQAMIAKSRESTEKPLYHITQARKGILREMGVMREGKRYMMRLTAARGEFVLSHDAAEEGLYEKLQGVQVALQDKLYYKNGDEKYPMQTVRFFAAEKAVFDYRRDQIESTRVTVKEYVLPGHHLPETFDEATLVFEGASDKAMFELGNGNVTAHGSGLKILVPRSSP